MTYYTDTFLNSQRTMIRGVPAFEAMSVDEILPHVRADDSPEVRSMLSDYISAAREIIEGDSQISLVQRNITIYLDCFPCGPIEIRYPPVQSVASVSYIDSAGDTQTLATDLYRADVTSKPGRIFPAYGQTWPTTLDVSNAVTVVSVVGYASVGLIPACAKQALRIAVKSMYDNGGVLCDDLRNSLFMMLDPIRWDGGV
jgi:uncharacterized phiE125 gp8 family phage protein